MNAPTHADDWRLPPFRLSNYTNMIRAGWTDGELERFAPGPFLRHGAVPHPDEFSERAGDTDEWAPA